MHVRILGCGAGQVRLLCHSSTKGVVPGERGLTTKANRLDGIYEVPVGGESYLFTLNTLQGVLFLIAGHTEVLVVLRDEALGTDGLLAAVAGEAGLVPAAVFVLHLAGTWHKGQEDGKEQS